jgi:hypothetical protein
MITIELVCTKQSAQRHRPRVPGHPQAGGQVTVECVYCGGEIPQEYLDIRQSRLDNERRDSWAIRKYGSIEDARWDLKRDE